MRKTFLLFFAFLLLLLPLVDFRVEPVFAKTFDCDPTAPCPSPGDVCPGGCDTLVTSSVCCQSLAGCPLQDDGTIAIWTWAHDPACTVTSVDINKGIYECKYKWQFEQCSATDSCLSTPYLEAGLCASSGCAVGGDYKTCCDNTTHRVVDCTGGRFTGVCPANSTAVAACVGQSCCTGGTPGPTATPAPACLVNCSQWNGLANAGTCWSNAGSGCQYCSGTNTCECGSCPPVSNCTAPGEFWCHNNGDCCASAPQTPATCLCNPAPPQCVSPQWCDVAWTNLTCNPNGTLGQDTECAAKNNNPDYECCSKQCPYAAVGGYVTVNGVGRAGPSVEPTCVGSESKYCSMCNKTFSISCNESWGKERNCSTISGTESTSISASGDGTTFSAGWSCTGIAYTTNACWDCCERNDCDAWYTRPNDDTTFHLTGLRSYTTQAAAQCAGLGSYTFTLNPPPGFTCGSWVLNAGKPTQESGTGCTAGNYKYPLIAGFQGAEQNGLVFDLLPVAEIKGNIYENTATKSCNSGTLVSKPVTFLDGTTPKCTVNSVGGAYSTNNCTNGWRPVTGKTYGISVTKDDLTESCSSGTNNCPAASCTANVTAPATQNFTVFPWKNAWFQTSDGDIHVNSDVQSIIPASCILPNCSPVLSEKGTGGTPGVVSTKGNVSLGNDNLTAKVSDPQNWKVTSETTENLTGFGANATRYDYAYFSGKFSNLTSTNFTGGGKPTCPGGSTPGGSTYCLYKSTSAVRINGSWTLNATDKYIFLINGDLTIDAGSITVADGGFLAFIVNGNLVITKTLGVNNVNSKAQKSLDGIFIADHFLDTTDDGTLSRTKTKRLNATGMFIAYDGINLYRNLSLDNNLNPAEYFVYRPDFLVNFPPAFGINRLTWQEVAP